MATPAAPIKTPLGHDELRCRTRAFGQRHRTILFLVDGRRPLSEVLSLAQQAGAQTSHFEELVRLGLIEVPSENMAPEPVLTAPGGLDTARVTSVELDLPAAQTLPLGGVQAELPFEEIDFVSPRPVVPLEPKPNYEVDAVEPPPPPSVDASAAVTPPIEPAPADMPAAAEIAPPPSAKVLATLANVAAQAKQRELLATVPASAAAPLVRPGSMARMPPQPKPKAAPARRSAPREVHGAPAPGARTASPHRPKTTAVRRAPSRDNLRASADAARSVADPSGEQMLQHVRELLIEALRLDSPLLRARTATRVRAAKSSGELIDLVWEIEKRLSFARQSRHELISLYRARELLGLGNTIVNSEGLSSKY
jgi:hypothetical protein